ncbi:hypothetical protein HD_1314 [[Haemophilus] ducreyi 35000HP]|uniref:Uncharacterized protein n=1 Tax=Haemophilus ducreyi (strain 35000HP / ATCC 700724) TaxID=233412 RepID=Q7VLU9_HAEDU|nr:hypothetical protein HD_1314 [[Haemophilus] ducreyi 35000HP]
MANKDNSLISNIFLIKKAKPFRSISHATKPNSSASQHYTTLQN